MKAVVWRGVGDIRYEEVELPKIQKPTDAIVRITTSAICGTDLHMIRGTLTGMSPGTILGHEGVGVIEELGPDVRNMNIGDRVVVPSTIACGYCSYCREGYYSQCDNANPNGPTAGTAFYGGPKDSGPFNGMQAEQVRVPFASINLVKLPDEVNDDQAIMISDIFPTGYFGADMARIKPGNSAVVFGCGPVGQFVIASLRLMSAGRIFAVDTIPSRLDMARSQGAEIINFNEEDPAGTLKRLTGGVGPDRAIDAVGVDAVRPNNGPLKGEAEKKDSMYKEQLEQVAPKKNPSGDNWHPGNAPSQVLEWAIKSVAKAGTVSIIGVYPQTMQFFPIGEAMGKNLKVNMGNCNHRKYVPMLVDKVRDGTVDPRDILTQYESLDSALDAYKAFDSRQPGWIKVKLAVA